MKIEFKKSEIQSNLDLVFINETLQGEFFADNEKQSFLFVPIRGDRILLSKVDYAEACKLLSGELSQIYLFLNGKAA